MNTLGTKIVVEYGINERLQTVYTTPQGKPTMRLNIPALTNIRLYIGTPRALR